MIWWLLFWYYIMNSIHVILLLIYWIKWLKVKKNETSVYYKKQVDSPMNPFILDGISFSNRIRFIFIVRLILNVQCCILYIFCDQVYGKKPQDSLIHLFMFKSFFFSVINFKSILLKCNQLFCWVFVHSGLF